MNLISSNVIEKTGDELTLYGGRSKQTGAIVFPMPEGGDADLYEKTPLKSEGKLWSYTVQRFPPKTPYLGPKTPEDFKPYGLGYVELEGQVIVETLLETDDFSKLKVGVPMKLTTKQYAVGEDGAPLYTYAFEPA